MPRKLVFAAGAAVGYVLGTRAGREKYDAIMAQVRGVKQRPEVQDAVATVKQQATEVSHKAVDTAKEKAHVAGDAAKSKTGQGDSGSTTSAGPSSDFTSADVPAVDPLAEPVIEPIPGSTGTSGLGQTSTPAPTVPGSTTNK